jgi:hypothetical protein
MLAEAWRIHDGLFSSTRVPSVSCPGRGVSVAEVGVLMLLGVVAAAATAFLDFSLRIPGHAILRSVFPMALGLALVPRRLAGSFMSVTALGAFFLFRRMGAGGGVGALTSLCLTGPLLDLALLGARRPWRLYLAFVLAGLGSNLAAFFVRWGFRLIGDGGTRPKAEWLAVAPWTYVLCGIAAGFLSALVWFHHRSRQRPVKDPETAP